MSTWLVMTEVPLSSHLRSNWKKAHLSVFSIKPWQMKKNTLPLRRLPWPPWRCFGTLLQCQRYQAHDFAISVHRSWRLHPVNPKNDVKALCRSKGSFSLWQHVNSSASEKIGVPILKVVVSWFRQKKWMEIHSKDGFPSCSFIPSFHDLSRSFMSSHFCIRFHLPSSFQRHLPGFHIKPTSNIASVPPLSTSYLQHHITTTTYIDNCQDTKYK